MDAQSGAVLAFDGSPGGTEVFAAPPAKGVVDTLDVG